MSEPKTFIGWTFAQFHPKAVMNTVEYDLPEWVRFIWEIPALFIAIAVFIVSYLPIAVYRAFWPTRVIRRWKECAKGSPQHG